VLDSIAAEVSRCTLCPLAHGRVKAVPGEGPATARVMLVGEAPGHHENQQGRPFVGAAGQFLDELLGAAKLSRAEVYITNIVKCRPPGNRDPLPEEIAACSGFLTRQVEALRPNVIVTLGRHSLGRFLPGEPISRVHGRPRRFDDLTVFPMYHPAAALHQPSLRRTLLDDMARLPSVVADAQPVASAPVPAPQVEPPRQLSLF